MRLTFIGAAMLLICSGDGVAQDQAPTTSHERAAAELIDVLQLESQLEEGTMIGVESWTRAMGGQTPASAELHAAFMAFMKEFMRWEDLRPEYIRIYRDAYTEAELMELIAFYKTPVGRKTIEITPELMRQAIEMRQTRVQKHLPELQRRIRVRMRGGQPDTVKQRGGS